MSLQIPTRSGVIQTIAAYLKSALPELDPTPKRRSYIGSQVTALGSALHDLYAGFKTYADKQPFPRTATGEFLTKGWWADVTKLTPNAAAPARGRIVIGGTAGVEVPVRTDFQVNGTVYRTEAGATISTQHIGAVGLSFDGSVATFAASVEHPFAVGQTVVISGASPAAYNGSVVVLAAKLASFTFQPSSPPPTGTATALPLASATFASVMATAKTTGNTTNANPGAELAIVSGVTGVAATAYITFGGLQGGTDAETDEAYRLRVVEALGSDYGTFTASEIEIVAKTVPGVTRVFVRTAQEVPPPGWPAEGQVRIAFLRDNDDNPIPSAQEVADVKARLMEEVVPAHTSADDVIVIAPTPVTMNFVFSSMTPNTASMRRSVQASLRQLFKETATFGQDIQELDYLCAIRETYDIERRERLKTFVLSSPSGVVTVGVDEMPILGTVTWL
jgi:uncharacterized phage protein gp47/JayE